MRRKIISIYACVLVMLAIMVTTDFMYENNLTVQGATITVDDSGGADYLTIQEAIDAASDGDTVYVYSGIYNQNPRIYKSINLNGEDKNTTVIEDEGVWPYSISIEADGVTVSGFTIINGVKVESSLNSFYNNIIFSIGYDYCIYLYFSDENYIANNTISGNEGIYLVSSNENDIEYNFVTNNNNSGVYLHSSNGNNIVGNYISNNSEGIYLRNSSKNIIDQNKVVQNHNGIYLHSSSKNEITWSEVSSNATSGIYIYYGSDNNIITDNNVSNSIVGIFISRSMGNIITKNTLNKCGFFIYGDSLDDWNTHYIDVSNTVNGKPMYYLKNQTSDTIPDGAGQVILANCTNININNQFLTNTSVGIELGFSSNNYITGNNVFSNTMYGIRLFKSDDNHIISNNASNKDGSIYLLSSNENNIEDNNIYSSNYGLYLERSDENNVIGNDISNSESGILLYRYSNSNNITGNNIRSNHLFGIRIEENCIRTNIIANNVTHNDNVGISLYSSSSTGNNVFNNNVSDNGECGIDVGSSYENNISNNILLYNKYGIYLYNSRTNNITNNTMKDCGIFIRVMFDSLVCWNNHNIDTTNTVNGKPIYYWKNINGGVIPPNAGQVILANCTNITIKDQELTNTSFGIQLGYSSNNDIIGNNVSVNKDTGMELFWSNNNNVSENIAYLNKGHGIWLSFSDGNNVTDNTVSNNGIGLGLSRSQENDIIGNTVIKNDWGINLGLSDWYADGNNVIKGNNISFNTEYGIRLYRSASNQIKDNSILKNNIGLYLYLRSDRNEIMDNDISSNDNIGIYIQTSSENEIKRNIISNNYYSMDFLLAKENLIYHNDFINNVIQGTSDKDYWDNGYPIGGNYWSDYNGVDERSGPNQDQPGSDGIGDTPYETESDMTDNYTLMEPFNLPGNYITLKHGWNLISAPRIQSSTKLEDVLSQINGSYRAVQWFNASDKQDPWKHYSISKPSHLNDLDKIDHTMGLQIYVSDPGGAILDFSGILPTQNQTIPLYKGWNMVGYPSLSNKYRPDALNNLVFGTEVDAVWTYNSGAQKWEEVGDLNYFVVGKGYWVHATQDCVWEVPV